MWPESEYLERLGRCTYAVAYLEWLVMELIRRFNGTVDFAALAGKPGGPIADQLEKAVRSAGTAGQLTDDLHEFQRDLRSLYDERNDVLHARPATDDQGRQRLCRWAPGKQTKGGVIDIERLKQLSDTAMDLARRADQIREAIKGVY